MKRLQVDPYRAFPFKPDAAPDTPSVIGPVRRPIHCPSDQRDSEHGGLDGEHGESPLRGGHKLNLVSSGFVSYPHS